MDEELSRQTLARQIAELAFAGPGDAVKLALSPETGADGLDLRLVAEIKRAKDGSFEPKLLDRQKLIELLTELVGPGGEAPGEKLYTAIDSAARALGETRDAV